MTSDSRDAPDAGSAHTGGRGRGSRCIAPDGDRLYLTGAVHEHGRRFDWREFASRVAEIRGTRPTGCRLSDLQQLRDQLPESEDHANWRKPFVVVDAGGWTGADAG